MVIHIGEDEFVSIQDLIMVLDESSWPSDSNQTSLNQKTVKISDNQTKSFVVTDQSIYESPIDSATLYKRDDVFKFLKSNKPI